MPTDLETFCRCGHDFTEHADYQDGHRAERISHCLADQPDRCSCQGYEASSKPKLVQR